MKYREKIRAIKLRKEGLSYKAILKKVDVSKSTLSIWLRNIELTKEQKNKLLNKAEIAMYNAAKRKVDNRIKRTNIIIEKAKKEVRGHKDDSLFLIGIALYWAEGAKSHDETVKFSNSDEKMIGIMMQWFREICRVPEEKFRVHVHMHSLHCRKDILKYWSKITNIPLNQFYKPYIKKTSLGQRKNILYNGTCSIVVNEKDLFRKIIGWKTGLEEQFSYPL
jgi:transcriptional regulator with XRE-family HTH domain